MIKRLYQRFNAWLDYNPPGSMSSKGWRLFKEEFKEKAPIRYWLKNDFKYKSIMPIVWKYKKVKDWARFRTYDRYHVINTGLPPSYYDPVTTVLHVNFNILKEFVEVEQAWQTFWWSDEGKSASWCMRHMPFYRLFYPFRNPELGIKHFEWAATLDDPKLPVHERAEHQAVAAREILVLYKWWVTDRPARKDIVHPEYSDQGLGDFMACFDSDFDKTASDWVEHRKSMDDQAKREEEWEKEDEDMLVRFVKIRRSLWT